MLIYFSGLRSICLKFYDICIYMVIQERINGGSHLWEKWQTEEIFNVHEKENVTNMLKKLAIDKLLTDTSCICNYKLTHLIKINEFSL